MPVKCQKHTRHSEEYNDKLETCQQLKFKTQRARGKTEQQMEMTGLVEELSYFSTLFCYHCNCSPKSNWQFFLVILKIHPVLKKLTEFNAVGKEESEGHAIFTLHKNWRTSIFECKSVLKEINIISKQVTQQNAE